MSTERTETLEEKLLRLNVMTEELKRRAALRLFSMSTEGVIQVLAFMDKMGAKDE